MKWELFSKQFLPKIEKIDQRKLEGLNWNSL